MNSDEEDGSGTSDNADAEEYDSENEENGQEEPNDEIADNILRRAS